MDAETTAEFIARVLASLDRPPWLVALAGIPGAGKSTVAAALHRKLPNSMVVPMDGYHIPRARLTAEQLERRGAPDTFDADSLRADLLRLRERRTGTFPAFDHAVKDPTPIAVTVRPGTLLVIVEGLYLLMRAWRLGDVFDFSVFLDCPLDVAMARVAERHLACGLADTIEAARRRAETNDRRNAEGILSDGCRERASLVVKANSP